MNKKEYDISGLTKQLNQYVNESQKKKKGDKMTLKGFIALLAIIVISILAIYGFYWIAKTLSYTIFYEDMVRETVREMVKPEYLKQIP